jgi:hypothetical protein
MRDEVEAKIRRRAHEMRESRSHPTAERRRLEAERRVTAEAEYVAISSWTAPVGGTDAERRNEAARIAGTVREAVAAARASAAERQVQPITPARGDP